MGICHRLPPRPKVPNGRRPLPRPRTTLWRCCSGMPSSTIDCDRFCSWSDCSSAEPAASWKTKTQHDPTGSADLQSRVGCDSMTLSCNMLDDLKEGMLVVPHKHEHGSGPSSVPAPLPAGSRESRCCDCDADDVPDVRAACEGRSMSLSRRNESSHRIIQPASLLGSFSRLSRGTKQHLSVAGPTRRQPCLATFHGCPTAASQPAGVERRRQTVTPVCERPASITVCKRCDRLFWASWHHDRPSVHMLCARARGSDECHSEPQETHLAIQLQFLQIIKQRKGDACRSNCLSDPTSCCAAAGT